MTYVTAMYSLPFLADGMFLYKEYICQYNYSCCKRKSIEKIRTYYNIIVWRNVFIGKAMVLESTLFLVIFPHWLAAVSFF